MSKSQIRDFQEGQTVSLFALLSEVEFKRGKNNKMRVNGRLTDSTGSIDFVCWNARDFADLQPDDAIAVKGTVSLYRDSLQLTIDRVRLINESDRDHGFDEGLLIPVAPVNLESTFGELDQALRETLSEQALPLWDAFLDRYGDAFRVHPAAKRVHHAYRGGLLMHTASLVRLATLTAEHYRAMGGKSLDLDVLLLGAVLHDAGKLFELGSMPGSDLTEGGMLVGHISMSYRLWHQLCDQVSESNFDGVPASLRTSVEHLILSHHGELEHGSPVKPKTPEAIVFSSLDRLDASVWTLWDGLGEEDRADVWPLRQVFARTQDQDSMSNPEPAAIILRGDKQEAA